MQQLWLLIHRWLKYVSGGISHLAAKQQQNKRPAYMRVPVFRSREARWIIYAPAGSICCARQMPCLYAYRKPKGSGQDLNFVGGFQGSVKSLIQMLELPRFSGVAGSGGIAMRSVCFALAGVVLVLTACAAPMRMREIESVSANCGNVTHQISMLKSEKAKNDNRLLAGIQSVAPAGIAFNIIRGTFGRNVMIATGEWAKAIDIKLAELRRKKSACGRRSRAA